MSKITRLEIVDHTNCDTCNGAGHIHIEGQDMTFECPACHGMGMNGRTVIFQDPSKKLSLSLQDEGRTLKVFVNKREA